MRRAVHALAAFSLLAAQPVLAQPQCASPTEQSTFDVQALRSELMVLATGCHDDAQYNAFIRRYQPDLQANERAIDAYFKARYGRMAQVEHDRFVTELANALSDKATSLGGDFCPRNGMMFNEVLALQSPAQLADYAAGKDLVPTSIPICVAVARKPAPVHRVAQVRRKKKR
jgi:hypothetical protein